MNNIMDDIATMTTQELEERLNEIYERFERVKGECFDKFLEMGNIQKEYEEVNKEIKKRNGQKT